MHNCAFCKNPLRPLKEWKGDDGRFYCSEFWPTLTIWTCQVSRNRSRRYLPFGRTRPFIWSDTMSLLLHSFHASGGDLALS
jgi:hypothetical protein